MTSLRVYSETLPYEEVTRARTVSLLARYGLEVVLAVRPWDVGALPRVAHTLADAGVTLAVWPMLSDEEGRWANARNAASFARFTRQIVDALDREAAPPREVLFDLEPSFEEARLLLPGASRDPRGLVALAAGASRARSAAYAAAEVELSASVMDLRARGIASSSAVWPLVALDPPGASGWQALLGTPVDGLATERVSVMVYTSILEGWSRGALRRPHAASLLTAATHRVVRRWGERASVSLGCVGTGAFEDEPIYRSPAELAEDVALARAAGCQDLSLFDLGGVLAREPAEAWLDAFVGAGDAVTASPPSGRVTAARTLARAATWALSRRRRAR
jgi:hypothetical protein